MDNGYKTPRHRFDQVAYLGPPPVQTEEELEGYYELFNHLWQDIAPQGAMEYTWVREIADDTWIIARNRRLVEMLAPKLQNRATTLSTETREAPGGRGGIQFCTARVQEYSEFAKRLQNADEAITRAVKRRNTTLREMEKRRLELSKIARRSVAKAEEMLEAPPKRAGIRIDDPLPRATEKKN
jgi:hypothetical protein